MVLDRDLPLSVDQLEGYTLAMTQIPPPKGHKCSVCKRLPEENKVHPTCAKCRGMNYCSRECQKQDWPNHKQWCSKSDKHHSFILKWFGRMSLDLESKIYLKMTLAEGFLDAFTQSSTAHRKLWVFSVNFFLCPIKEEHLAALASPNIPLGELSHVPMVGRLMASKFVDISDQEKYPLQPRIRDMWQAIRDHMDSCDLADSISIVVIFEYLGAEAYASLDVILSDEIAEVKKKRELARNTRREFPVPVRHLDRWLEELRNSKGEKVVCEMGDRDKVFFRINNLVADLPR
ncbi:hypothetical protein GALMADRAFT_154487 [Galerina marginata CBS 339.88]|uniref:MYND-type domain-containing protein n=1 Tax=Galerina marginata (strain CBS 339.88) TaxID=685588 RepID=A0A067TL60_GALM3|nr:hypothetical protein GALMADRAFT_154487 [Galerina marginata CBS 339.88]